MKKKILLGLFVASVILIVVYTIAPKKKVFHQIYASFVGVDSCHYDFGKITKTGETIEHQFVFTNNSKEILFISDVIAGCSCVTTDFTKNVFDQEQTAAVRVKYSPSNKKGTFRKSILVLLNDGKYYLQVSIQGFIL
ncbi:MAG: DUF1573 domain-containing protein [Prevotella sp.]|nr:DUF1573 domain-containing protein [Prevotella sp.]